MPKPEFSDRVKDLILKARIVSFATWHDTHPAEAIALVQAADDQRRYLSDADLADLAKLAPAQARLMPVAKRLRDQVADIVDEARAGVLAKFPTITEPGGGLYPPERADACWRDFWQFLRCITYGIAGQRVDYTSAPGLEAMQRLYQELQVPLDAMVLGLEGIKAASLKRIQSEISLTVSTNGLSESDLETLPQYFDHLIDRLRQFLPTANSSQRMLLAHNFTLTDGRLPALSRDQFAQVFVAGFAADPTVQVRPLSHPHWMIEILFPAAGDPAEIGSRCAHLLAQARYSQAPPHTTMPQVLVLGGCKTTPVTQATPGGLQTGEWGVDVVETDSEADFLAAMGWEQAIATKPSGTLFKVNYSG
jgi:hypothetical protein